ncbi:hypothetical protein ACTWM0_10265 [Pseudomonas machongensis]
MLLLFALLILSGVYLPLYSDEAVTKFSVARFFLEHGQMVSFFPQCTATVGHGVALVFYPAAVLLSMVYAPLDPLGIRIIGVMLAFAWFALMAWWCARQATEHWKQRFVLLAGLCGLGVMPYLWVMSRPEQFMLVPMLFFCVAALQAPGRESPGKQIAAGALAALLASTLFYAHPKAVFFTPFLMAAAWGATAHFPRWARTALLLYIAALGLQALRDATTLSACEDAPVVQSVLASNILAPGTLLSAPSIFLSAVLENLQQFFPRVLKHLVFTEQFQSGWLPPIAHTPGFLPVLNALLKVAACLLMVIAHLGALIAALFALSKRRLPLPLLLAALLAAGDLLNAALYNRQNFYSLIQYVPISIMILALLLAYRPLHRAQTVLATSVSALAVVSLLTLAWLLTPSIVRNASYPAATIPGQPISIPVLGTEQRLEGLRELGQRCNIPQQSAKFLVVDHMTYFAYRQNTQPVHVLYISELAYGGDLKGRLLPFLKAHGSPGLIARCEWIPAELRDQQQDNGQGYCCVDLSGN